MVVCHGFVKFKTNKGNTYCVVNTKFSFVNSACLIQLGHRKNGQ